MCVSVCELMVQHKYKSIYYLNFKLQAHALNDASVRTKVGIYISPAWLQTSTRCRKIVSEGTTDPLRTLRRVRRKETKKQEKRNEVCVVYECERGAEGLEDIYRNVGRGVDRS